MCKNVGEYLECWRVVRHGGVMLRDVVTRRSRRHSSVLATMGLHPFTTYVLRNYYQCTGWNEDNLYSNLTRSSDAILDFAIPHGLRFSISKAPNSLFRTTYSMNALPSLKGSLGYIFTSCDLNLMNSKDVPFKNLVERFQIHDQPKKPEGKPEEWLAGKRVDDRDYLLSGLFYIPTGRMDAFYTTRISSTLQASISSITQPHYGTTPMANSGELGSGSLLLSLQHDTGRWCTEYLWDSDGGIWGARVLRNFGKLATSITGGGDMDNVEKKTGVKRVDEEEAMEGGLRGRISAGAEIYASAEKSAGMSFGIRFTTLPDNSSLSVAIQDPMSSTTAMATSLNATNTLHPPPLNQPPTVITAIFSPITGHILTSYAARVSQDLALCSRFSFNINSYESEWTMGAEWWMKDRATSFSEPNATNSETLASTPSSPREIQAVLKARISTSADMAFLWEGRLRNALVSMGVISNLSNRSRPIAAIGLELAYFSSE